MLHQIYKEIFINSFNFNCPQIIQKFKPKLYIETMADREKASFDIKLFQLFLLIFKCFIFTLKTIMKLHFSNRTFEIICKNFIFVFFFFQYNYFKF